MKPKTGEKYDINNLLYEKFLFDITTFNVGVRLQITLFSKLNYLLKLKIHQY